jgi:hypothetical protein
MFDMRCRDHGIEHRLTKPSLDQWPGRAHEPDHQGSHRQAHHYSSHQQLRTHLSAFIDAYNFAKRLKTLKGLTPYEHICKIWNEQPKRFRLDPIHHMPGLNT